jgi:ABC-type multidrug transport system fused ATPase/permease subunit
VVAVLPRAERRGLVVVLCVGLVAAVFETIGAASILPFMALVMDPTLAARHPAIMAPLSAWGITSPHGALVTLGALVALTLLAANAAGAAAVWAQHNFLARLRCSLSDELFGGFLRHPYDFHVQNDTATLLTVMLTDLDVILASVVGPLLIVVARGFVAAALVSLLFVREPLITLVALGLLGSAYLLTYRLLRNHQSRVGSEMNIAAVDRFRSAYEGLGGVKELIVLGRQRFALSRYHDATSRLSRSQALAGLTATLPRFVLETVAFGGIVGATLWIVVRGDGSAQAAVPILALYAFAAYRLMPALQQIFGAAVAFGCGLASFETVERHIALIRGDGKRPQRSDGEAIVAIDAPTMDRDLELRDVSFTYPGATRAALRDVSITIRRNESIGLVGRTGAGKSTLADIVLGLYQPSAGHIALNGVVLDSATLKGWRRRVGYVPQSVFLANATVRQNIAYGVDDDQIDTARVLEAARLAQLDEFVRELPAGYDTCIGERGVKLSGGQRQRIGIARALYDRPDVLVFDEATSALDGLTEDAVMEAIRMLSGQRTILLIAHRLRTVKACDRVIMLDAGAVVAQGRYDDLMRVSLPFRRLAGRGETVPDHERFPSALRQGPE